jgi:hypothetical protein
MLNTTACFSLFRQDVVTQAMFNGGADHTKHMKRLMESRKLIGSSDDDAVTTKLSSGNTAFDKKVQSNFAKLIEDAKRRKEQLKTAGGGGTSGTSNDDDVAQPNSSDDPSPMPENGNATDSDMEANVAAKEAPSPSKSTTSAVDSEESNLAKEAKASVSVDTNSSAVARLPSSVSKNRDSMAKKKSPNLPRIPAQKAFGKTDMKLPSMFQKSSTSPSSASSEIAILDDDVDDKVTDTKTDTDTSSCKSPPSSSVATSPPLSASSSFNSATETRKREAVPLSAGSAGGNKRSKRVTSGPWNCVLCTFFNTKRSGPNSRCEVCDTPRSVATATC